jgi:competence protein ComEC
MIGAAAAFVGGVLLLQRLPLLPSGGWLLLFPLCLALAWRLPRLRLPLFAAVGFLWALAHGLWLAPAALDRDLEARDLLLEGYVAGLPELAPERTLFLFDPVAVSHQGQHQGSLGRVRLSWYGQAPALHVGERWQLRARLKARHGFVNPGGFDYEGWLFQQGLVATGHVRQSAQNLRQSSSAGYPVQRLRERLRREIRQALGEREDSGMLAALILGDRSGLKPAQWDSFTRTGTNHLVAISGLHIGIVAALFFWLIRRLWPVLGRLPLWLAAPRAAALGALVGATGYAALAGFAVPTQRALIMLLVVMGALLLGRNPRPGNSLGLALLLVTLWDPLAVLSGGFWLSFCAVAAIWYGIGGRVSDAGLWRRWGKVQWMVFLGLAPLLLALFQQISLVAPLVNLLAVPWFSLVLVPLLLLGTLLLFALPPLGVLLLNLGETLLGWTLSSLQWVAQWPLATWQMPQLPGWVWPVAGGAVLLLLAPRGLPGRWLGGILLAPLVLVRPVMPQSGDVWLDLLDVGQGLSAVVRTRHHTLVYDTGPRFSQRFDAASAVLIPFLRSAGLERIDLLILSNADADHAGGAQVLAATLPLGRVLSGEPERLPAVDAAPCMAGERWSWDGVEFQLLHPERAGIWRGNNNSCVLSVENSAGRILFPGDVEAPVEQRLVDAVGQGLSSRILLAPHHGSASSSSPSLVRAVAPEYVLFSTGYRNRYGFPKPAVEARWRAAGAQTLATADSGAISFRLSAAGELTGPILARLERRRRWTDVTDRLRQSAFLAAPHLQ